MHVGEVTFKLARLDLRLGLPRQGSLRLRL